MDTTEIRTQISELKRRRADLDDTIQRAETRKNELPQLEEKRGCLEDDLEAVEEEITELESVVEEIESTTDESSETAQLRDKLESFRDELSNTERRADEINNQLEFRRNERASLSEERDELENLRGRIDQLETELVETLNLIIADLLDRHEYENRARVWLERQTTEDNSNSTFELHIVREADDGSVCEDTAATLSESEREVIGLVVALAGYLVHDVDREVPFLLLDSVEMIDGQRLADLIKYIQEKTKVEFLSVVLLPKDAKSVEEGGVFDEYAMLNFEPVSA